MDDLSCSTKEVDSISFESVISQLLETKQINCQDVVSFGLEKIFQFKVTKPMRICLHSNTCGIDNFILHYGAGACNKIAVWMHDNPQSKPRRISTNADLDCRLLHLLYIPTHFKYVAACADMTIKTFDNEFNVLSSLELLYTVLDMIYCDTLNVIVVSGAGLVQILEFGQYFQDPLAVRSQIKLTYNNTKEPGIFQVHLNEKNRSILAACSEAIFFITWDSLADLTCKLVLENKHRKPLSRIAEYSRERIVITGSQDGIINAWSISKQSFQLKGGFQGHTKAILRLVVYWKEPVLFSLAADDTIRLWSIDTFSEMHVFHVHEPIFDMKLVGIDSVLYTTSQAVIYSKLSLCYRLLSNIGTPARWISRFSMAGQQSRMVYVGSDGAVRLVSPINGKTISIIYPIIEHDMINTVHDPQEDASYSSLSNGNVMVFSTATNPCSTVQLWVAKTLDDRVCSIEAIPSECLHCDAPLQSSTMLIFGGHLSGNITLMKGRNFEMSPHKAHVGSVLKLSARKASFGAKSRPTAANLISYSTDKMIIIWTITILASKNTSLPHEIVFSGLIQIHMRSTLIDTLLVGELLIVCTRQHIVFHRLSINQIKTSNVNYKEKDFFAQSKVQEHFGNLKQICSCESLQIIATSGKDRHIYVWDTESNLIKKLCFHKDIEALCFASDRGDLLVALQGSIYHVPLWNLLSEKYTKTLLQKRITYDVLEDSIPFNSMLKFWYDSMWVPEIAIGETNCFEHRKEPLFFSQEELSESGSCSSFENVTQQDMEKRYSGSQRSMMSSNAANSKTRTNMAPDVDQSLMKKANAFVAKRKKRDAKNKIDIEKATNASCNIEAQNAENEEAAQEDNNEHDEVEEELTGFWPCAPDGYLPNSVVRSIIRSRGPRDYSSLIKELEDVDFDISDKIQGAFFGLSNLLRLITGEDKEIEVEDSVDGSSSGIMPSFVLTDSDSADEILQDAKPSDLLESRKPSVKNVARRSQSWLTKHERHANTGIVRWKDQQECKDGENTSNKGNSSSNVYKFNPRSMRTSHLESEFSKTKSAIQKSKSMNFEASKPIAFPKSKFKLTERVPIFIKREDDELRAILSDHLIKFFPNDVDLTIETVVPEILRRLSEDDPPTTTELLSFLVAIKDQLQCSTSMMSATLKALRAFVKSEEPVIRLAAVKTTIELAKRDKNSIIPDLIDLLNDPMKFIREEAKQALEILAGVTDHKSLISVARKMHMLKENKNARHVKHVKVKQGSKFQLVNNFVKEWLLNSKPPFYKESVSCDEHSDPVKDKYNFLDVNEARKRKSEFKMQLNNHMESIAPRLTEKYRKITVRRHTVPSPKSTRHSAQHEQGTDTIPDLRHLVGCETDNTPSKADIMEKFAVSKTKFVVDSNNSLPTKVKKKRDAFNVLLEIRRISTNIKDIPGASQTKKKLFSLLLEVSAYILVLLRTHRSRTDATIEENATSSPQEQQKTLDLDDDTLDNLSNCLNKLYRGDKDILYTAQELKKYLQILKQKIQQQIAKNALERYIDDPKEVSSNSGKGEKDMVEDLETKVVLQSLYVQGNSMPNLDFEIEKSDNESESNSSNCQETPHRLSFPNSLKLALIGEKDCHKKKSVERSMERINNVMSEDKCPSLKRHESSKTNVSIKSSLQKPRKSVTSKEALYITPSTSVGKQKLREPQLSPIAMVHKANESVLEQSTKLPHIFVQNLKFDVNKRRERNKKQKYRRNTFKLPPIHRPILESRRIDLVPKSPSKKSRQERSRIRVQPLLAILRSPLHIPAPPNSADEL